jgi:hypothetical protein
MICPAGSRGASMLTRASVVVQADEVLRQALLRGRPHVVSADSWLRIDIKPVVVGGRSRVASLSTVRPASEARRVGTAPTWEEALPEDVLAALDDYEVDWEDPLRIETFQAWRAHLSQKRDFVTRRSNEIVITTRPARRSPAAGSGTRARSRELSAAASRVDVGRRRPHGDCEKRSPAARCSPREHGDGGCGPERCDETAGR